MAPIIRGTLILESLREGATLSGFRFVVHEVGRGRPNLSPQQIAVGTPKVWSAMEFELEEARAAELVTRCPKSSNRSAGTPTFHLQQRPTLSTPGECSDTPDANPRAGPKLKHSGERSESLSTNWIGQSDWGLAPERGRPQSVRTLHGRSHSVRVYLGDQCEHLRRDPKVGLPSGSEPWRWVVSAPIALESGRTRNGLRWQTHAQNGHGLESGFESVAP